MPCSSRLDITGSSTLTLPEHEERYLSAMVVNNDHYIHAIYHDAGSYDLTVAEHGTAYVMVGVRILADPNDPADLAEVADLQDQLGLTAGSATPFVCPEYDPQSMDATRSALLALVATSADLKRTFGRPDQVDPIRHLMGAAAGWGGLPTTEAVYAAAAPQRPGNHELTLAGVPVDGFWSVSVYNAKASSSRIPATPTASTTSPERRTTTARSPSVSAITPTTRPTRSPRQRTGTSWSGCTDHGQRLRTAPGSCPS